MKDVVSLTQGLFVLSKVTISRASDVMTVAGSYFYSCLQETAQLESEAFLQQQKVALAAELKSVLDSWVRYEQQAKESEQAELAKTVIERVLRTIKEEKTQKDILASAMAEIERTLPGLFWSGVVDCSFVC
jgi:F-type H+-transporting ATPase subunit b